MLLPIKLINTYREYVWGGRRLRPGEKKTAEAWIVYEGNLVASEPYLGKTLSEVAELEGAAFLGEKPISQSGLRFPLLIKLLDCNQWLSLQVHPNDQQAQKLEGPNHFGKTEAWFVIEADADAELISGFRTGVHEDEITTAVQEGCVLELVDRKNVAAGDTFFVSPGTIHALGPGLLIYEVQQTSDVTYRVYDWGRTKSDDRMLHIEEAIAVLDPAATGLSVGASSLKNGWKQLVSCDYFALDLVEGASQEFTFDTMGESFAAFTAIAGNVLVSGDGWAEELNTFETLIIPAGCGKYRVQFEEFARALNAYVP